MVKFYALDSSFIHDAEPKDGFVIDMVRSSDYVELERRIAELEKQRDGLVSENAALKSKMNPEIIPDDVLNAFSDTEEIDSDSFDEKHSFTWVRNPEEVIKAVLAAMVKPETPQTDAAIAEIGARAVESFEKQLTEAREVAYQFNSNTFFGYRDAAIAARGYANKLRGGGCEH